MDPLSTTVAIITLTTVLSYIVNFVDEYRQLIATEELRHLITKVASLRAIIYWATVSIENSSRHASHSFEADFQYKAFWEDLQRIIVAFEHTTKLFNNRVHRICGKTGPKLSMNYDGLLKLRRMRSSKGLFQVLQDRLSFHESCIKLLIDNMTTYTQPALLRSVDSSIPITRPKALTPQLVSGFYQGKDDYLDELLQRLKPFSMEESVQHRQIIWVHGQEGAGKTHLCSKFADEHKSSYWGVFWVDANKKCFESLNPTASRIDRVDQLSDVKEPWLLIVDNAEDLTHAEGYFPSGDKGHILVTARSPPPYDF
ncbi:unnamed protein product [Penicillium camemberti]|uniref:Str. FM013 n=1 Tax=Penicillium camemberti (strain FM 013) TaxID=1429867 RepID=A0A0G4PTL1_PENC3|nr:unnamed protein product [Penicillium camemberti]